MRVYCAKLVNPMDAIGSMKLAGPVKPTEGSQWSFTEKIMMSTKPRQNCGVAAAIMDRILMILSVQEYCFNADIVPNGTPMTTPMATAPKHTVSEIGRRVSNSSSTGCLVVYDVPKSPVTTSFM